MAMRQCGVGWRVGCWNIRGMNVALREILSHDKAAPNIYSICYLWEIIGREWSLEIEEWETQN